MHFYKIAGTLIVIFSGFMGAYTMNSAATKKCAQIEALIELLRYTRIQIECFALPASEIISSLDRKLLWRCGLNKDRRFNDFSELFNALVISDAEAAKIIKNFASGFGRGYREEQLAECDYYISVLCEVRQKLYGELPNRKKVNSVLCISSALGAVVLLL